MEFMPEMLLALDVMENYNLIIEASVIIILSFFFGEVSRKTNIPSVLLLIILGVVLQFALKAVSLTEIDYSEALFLS